MLMANPEALEDQEHTHITQMCSETLTLLHGALGKQSYRRVWGRLMLSAKPKALEEGNSEQQEANANGLRWSGAGHWTWRR